VNKRYIILILGVVLIASLIWLQRRHHPALVQPGRQTTEAVPLSSPKLSNPPSANIVTNSNQDFSERIAEKEKRRKALEEKSLNEWRTPIQFYGLVKDESNSIVFGAQVDFECNDLSQEGTSLYHTESDANGLFSIKDITGKLLRVTVSKSGYYAYEPHGEFFYYAGLNQNFVPDVGNPVVFRLRKKGKGADLIEVDYPGFAHIAQLKHDGTPVELDLFQGKQVADESGQLKLEFWRNLSEKNAKLFNWKFQMSVPGGGLVETDEEFPFEAPDNGYQPSIIMDMPTNAPNWQGNVKTEYYFQLGNGEYGRFGLDFLPYNGVFTVHSAINPTGSRNLEPAN
jgi:hypothetical protein